MVIVEYSSYFVKSFRKMPRSIQEKAAELDEIFKKDPSNSLLHQKRLKGRLKGLQSFRITRNYRMLFAWKTKNTALFYEIADRKHIYR